VGSSCGFWDIEARAFPEDDLWLGPCPLRCALDADAWVEEQWDADGLAVCNPEDLAGLWARHRNEQMIVRTIFAWEIQVQYDARCQPS
jgi:hypothetical protein